MLGSEKDNWLLRQILVDAQVTADVEKTWINNKSRLDSRRGVYLVFLATRSGLTRYVDLNLDDIRYESPFTTVPPPLTTVIRDKNETEQKLEEEPAPALEVEPGYMHFINNHTSSLDELFYQRALRAPTNSYVFDVDTVNRVWKSEPYQSPYGIRENFSILITATTAVYIGGDGSENAAKSPAAVVGFEMLYNSFVEMFLNASDSICKVNNSQHTKCLLVDEHAYIIVTNDLIEYSKPVKLKQPLGLLEPDVMSKLLDNEIFDRVRYIDYQAVCQNETLTSAAYKILSPIFNLLNLITWAWKEFIMLLVEYNIWSLLSGWVLPTEAYTETFRSSFMELGLSCDEISDFFVLNRDSLAARNNFISDTVDFQCRESGTVRCEKTLFASLIPRTNMLLLIIEQPGDCTATDCLNQNVKRNFSERVRSQFVTAYGASDKLYGRETQWRDKTKKLDGQHSTEVVSDSSREMAEKNKPKPPPRCKIGPRFRRAPHRQCVDQHEDVDDLHILCSGGIRHLNLHMLLAFAVFVAVSF